MKRLIKGEAYRPTGYGILSKRELEIIFLIPKHHPSRQTNHCRKSNRTVNIPTRHK
ncbi:MAG: hypothetical protein LBJ00_04345 [Planctomycetaceae bacterium]|nr:hypothetical protein [Planctomycetaceae bacterium]